MKRIYNLLRLAGYVSGLVGGAVLLWARRASWDYREAGLGVGSLLLVLMFVLFFASYVIYFIGRSRRPIAPRRPILSSDKDDGADRSGS